ncbi:hypothetical protein DPMN_108224 [Dreissena polymorpha]|uniref:Uncharacterized protein n=1 Tax=Dreissena polymorpha TaxID=45954 RepID=A0A9D4K8C7_DREPO|nr:hypothetical protein DPMN_108224 [Dreissena polymorpha]
MSIFQKKCDGQTDGRTDMVRALWSPGPSRFANAVEFFNSVTLFPGAAPVEAGQQPGRITVNPGLVTVYPGEATVVAGNAQRPGRAPVYRNSTGIHWRYNGIRPRQS